jgi:oligopeptidase B
MTNGEIRMKRNIMIICFRIHHTIKLRLKAYPNMYVSTGLHDSQVQYFEPAKWVAKLRVMKTNDKQLFLDTNMDAGHGGASGRFEALKELAKEFAFLLDLEKIKK